MLQLQITKFTRGSYIVVEGKADSDHFYIIQQGSVSCMKASGQGQSPVMLGPGDFVGVVPCMAGRLQIETAIAQTEVIAIAVKKEQYPDLIVNNTPVALKIIKTFANRMRVMNEMLTKATLNKVETETNEQVYRVGQYYEKVGKLDIACYAYYQFLKTRPVGPMADDAKKRFVALKPRTNVPYFEPTADMSRMYSKDQMIFSESQSGADMFIIQKGEVAISKVVNGNEVTLAVLKRGDMFGEMALLENKPRSASAIAFSDCTLMVVNRNNFNQMVSSQPQMISKLTTTLADRLWSMYRQLDNAQIKDPCQKMIDMLALQFEKQRKFAGMNKVSEQTELTPKDLANMCGLTPDMASRGQYQFQSENNFRIVNGTIFVKDLGELEKQSAFFRKQSHNGK